MKLKHIILLFSLLFSAMLSAQDGIEICNNGIDDDNDGLIDLNDDDCNCDSVIPSPLIPNESFEEMTCCPTGEADFQCATDWQQASAATSDYYHTCGITFPSWIGHMPPDGPIPDGEGYVGFRDGRANDASYKEYVGACLTATMEVGKTYVLDFFLGFPRGDVGFNHIDMTIYGTTECSNVPFGGGNSFFGCPTNGSGWTQMSQQFVSGNNEWVNVVFELQADKPYTAIVLGPPCQGHPDFTSQPYFFVDRLNLVEEVDVLLPYADIDGSICEDEVTLQAAAGNDFVYQWYKDGVAIMGEETVDFTVQVNAQNIGVYSVLISTPDGCFVSEDFELTLPVLNSSLEATICSHETYEFNGQQLNISDTYQATYQSVQGCDSIVTLELEVLPSPQRTVQGAICDGESFVFNGVTYSQETSEVIIKDAPQGCDSIIALFVNVSNSPVVNQSINICENENVVIDGVAINQTQLYTFNYTAQNGCDSTLLLNATVHPTYSENANATICEGESYVFGSQILTASDVYTENLQSQKGCDSTVTLTLQVANASMSSIAETICEGQSFAVGDTTFAITGQYSYTTTNANGCDSIVDLTLDVRSYTNGVLLPRDTTIEMGASLNITPLFIHPLFFQYTWTDQEANLISNDAEISLEEVIFPTNITFLAVDEYGCTDMDEIAVRIDRNIGVYAANIFSPNRDGINDFFRPVVNGSIKLLLHMSVYDRWGNLVYHEENINNLEEWKGWDGNFNGSPAISGVYVYTASFSALDNSEETISGDITLIR